MFSNVIIILNIFLPLHVTFFAIRWRLILPLIIRWYINLSFYLLWQIYRVQRSIIHTITHSYSYSYMVTWAKWKYTNITLHIRKSFFKNIFKIAVISLSEKIFEIFFLTVNQCKNCILLACVVLIHVEIFKREITMQTLYDKQLFCTF